MPARKGPKGTSAAERRSNTRAETAFDLAGLRGAAFDRAARRDTAANLTAARRRRPARTTAASRRGITSIGRRARTTARGRRGRG